ncbi:dnaG, DNA primase [uncultured Caudovirales phage]|uniref:DnaG, DNA primase n=1 Tax=uncultured Caudovirales phage TaxID=2100421 RepID=A0A6J5RS17_9CAUD|nr:dnaG, DNA primase [uncultured Caudovirales phage]
MYENVVKSCRFLLNNYPDANYIKSYLDSRLTFNSQELFQFGYFPNIFNLNVLTDLVSEDELRASGLCFSKTIEDSLFPRIINSLHFEDFPLIMPFRDTYGEIVALVGRNMLSDQERSKNKISKYKNTKFFNKGQYVFGLYENKENIIKNDLVYIVEGQFDVIRAMESGLKNVVALGCCHMTPYQFSVISRYTKNIILLLDNDQSGEKGRLLIERHFGDFANIQNFYIPEPYKDIDEYLTKNNILKYEDICFDIKC